MNGDQEFIRETLRLASQGRGLVSPNPLVGSVAVADGKIIGSGFHRYAELKHAEVWAIEQAGTNARGATLYVNLEPCSHTGSGKRTPPCVDAILNAGISRVVAATLDPNPKVNGKGFDRLRQSGVTVDVGLSAAEASRLNEIYFKFVTRKLPFVHIKSGMSLDARITTRTGESKWITSEDSRNAAQALRHEHDAILVGLGTAQADDPLLTDRSGLKRHRPLVRVVLDAGLRLSPSSRLVNSAAQEPLLVFTADCEILDSMGFPVVTEWGSTFEDRRQLLASKGVEIVRVPVNGALLDLPTVLEELGRRDISSVLVEGGASVSASLVEQRLVDKFTFYVAPMIIGGSEARPAIGGEGVDFLADAFRLRDLSVSRCGVDLVITAYPQS